MLLVAEKCIRGGIFRSIYHCISICLSIYHWNISLSAKAQKKYMKDYDKNKKLSYLHYWDVNNLYGWQILQKLSVNKFEWIKDTSEFNEDFIKNCNEKRDKGCFFKVHVQYPENSNNLYQDLPSLPEKVKIEKVEKFVANIHGKIGCYSHE